MIRRIFILTGLLFITHVLKAHEIRPAYLLINQSTPTEYQVFWKIPSIEGKYVNIQASFPDGFDCQLTREESKANALIRNYGCRCEKPLSGQKIAIQDLEKTLIDVLVHINLLDDIHYSFLLQSDKPDAIVPREPNQWEVIKTYIGLGISHILVGWDHLLFVLGLLFLVKGIHKLLWTITAFTLAHSITLALSSLDLFSLPGPPVEAVIAWSIVFLAREYLCLLEGKKTITAKYPWVVSFSFGLLHGFGFAGVLGELGFPQKQVPLALLNFNTGVEIGQVIFIAICFIILWIIQKMNITWPRYSYKVIPYAMGTIGMFWVIERVLNF